MPGQGGSNTTMWLVLGGVGVIVVVLLMMNSNNNSSTQNQSTPATPFGSLTSNTGTPLNNNGSYVGYTDPVSGINWILDASQQWIATLPQGSLPPNYTPGAATLNPTNNNILAQL